MNNFLSKIKRDPLDELKIFSGKFISIGLLARYPERLLDYLLDQNPIAMTQKIMK